MALEFDIKDIEDRKMAAKIMFFVPAFLMLLPILFIFLQESASPTTMGGVVLVFGFIPAYFLYLTLMFIGSKLFVAGYYFFTIFCYGYVIFEIVYTYAFAKFGPSVELLGFLVSLLL